MRCGPIGIQREVDLPHPSPPLLTQGREQMAVS